MVMQQTDIVRIKAERDALIQARNALIAEYKAAKQAFTDAKRTYEDKLQEAKDAVAQGDETKLAEVLKDIDASSIILGDTTKDFESVEKKFEILGKNVTAFQNNNMPMLVSAVASIQSLAKPAPIKAPAPNVVNPVMQVANRLGAVAGAGFQRIQAALPPLPFGSKPKVASAISPATPPVKTTEKLDELKAKLEEKETELGAQITSAEQAMERIEKTMKAMTMSMDEMSSKLDVLLAKLEGTLEQEIPEPEAQDVEVKPTEAPPAPEAQRTFQQKRAEAVQAEVGGRDISSSLGDNMAASAKLSEQHETPESFNPHTPGRNVNSLGGAAVNPGVPAGQDLRLMDKLGDASPSHASIGISGEKSFLERWSREDMHKAWKENEHSKDVVEKPYGFFTKLGMRMIGSFDDENYSKTPSSLEKF